MCTTIKGQHNTTATFTTAKTISTTQLLTQTRCVLQKKTKHCWNSFFACEPKESDSRRHCSTVEHIHIHDHMLHKYERTQIKKKRTKRTREIVKTKHPTHSSRPSCGGRVRVSSFFSIDVRIMWPQVSRDFTSSCCPAPPPRSPSWAQRVGYSRAERRD